jgi:predicted dehydrogenase
MNAGYIPPEHWVHSQEGGGRNVGEACHIYDLFNFLTGSTAACVRADAVGRQGEQYAGNDDFVATISYDDGSVCTLTYTALGDRAYPKETMEIFVDGRVLAMRDYKSLTISGRGSRRWRSLFQQKGHLEELEALADCLLKGSEWPISLGDQISAARIAFEVEEQIHGG